MTPAARLAALMEIIDLLLLEWQQENPRPAEQVLKAYYRQRRYMGSSDRRMVQESCFTLLRRFGRLKTVAETIGLPVTGRSLGLLHAHMNNEDLAGLCTGGRHAPAAVTSNEAAAMNRPWPEASLSSSLPAWLYELFRQQYGAETDMLIAALMQPAPLDLRVNRLKTTRENAQTALAAEGIMTTPIEGFPDALEAPRHAAVTITKAYSEGWIEIQDRGSQQVIETLLSLLPPRSSPLTILDYCAGAGGKSLALASALENKARIMAWDIDPKRLAELPPRATRAGATCIGIHPGTRPPTEQADLVLLDVPCSGTGTIRRHPDLPWRLSSQKLAYYMQLQKDIVRQGARLVKPGGLLYYVTCSLLEHENYQCVNDFLTEEGNFRVVTREQMWDKEAMRKALGLEFLPHRQGGDGFFAVLLKQDGVEY